MRSAQWGKSLAKNATVCVHMATDRVGVRELRQNLSRYLQRVARGERLQVTERGKPVAVLGPVDESGSALRRLVASGRATPPEGDLLDLAPPKGPVSTKGTDALRELREDRA
jgi:prevent-host-death family protein